MELYRAFTVRENYKDRDTVVVDWFCDQRTSPVAPLEELVEGAGAMEDERKKELQSLLDQLFTLEETERLAIFMRATSGFEVKKKKIELPIKDANKTPDFSGRSHNIQGDYFVLEENPEYPLGMKVTGFADLSEPPNIRSMV